MVYHWGMGTVQGRVWKSGKLLQSDFPLAELSDLLQDPQLLLWVDLESPEPELLYNLAAELGADHHSVEDALEPFERPKAKRHATYMFITCYATIVEEDEVGGPKLSTPQVSAFILPNALITVRTKDFDFDEILARWTEGGILNHGVGALLHGMLDTIVDGHFTAIQQLDDQVEDLEELLFRDDVPPNTFQRQLFDLRKILTQLRRKVTPMREAISSLMRFRYSGSLPVDHDLDGYFDDLYDHTIRTSDWSDSVREAITNAHETALSLQDARMNEIMKKLAAWAAIIAVPTAVTGWFGQNIPFPTVDAPLGVVVSTVLIIFGAGGLYLLFRKFDWL